MPFWSHLDGTSGDACTATKSADFLDAIGILTAAKTQEEAISKSIAALTDKPGLKRLATAIVQSSRLIAEDLHRKGGIFCSKTLK